MNPDDLTSEQWYTLLQEADYKYDFPIPTWQDYAASLFDFANTQYPLRPLGFTPTGKKIEIKEEDRSHTYIIGSTQEGKSKFIEHLVRGDIKRSFGCCVLDPSSGGKTVYSILRYCIKNKVQKVLLIDPKYATQFPYKVPQLSPFVYNEKFKRQLQTRSSRILRDTLRVIYRDDVQTTTRVNRYMPALITVLYNAQASLHDSQYFTDKSFAEERQQILSHTPKKHPARVALESVFGDDAKAKANYDQAVSTILRINPLINDTLGLMFMAPVGINFYRLVKEKWVILVNLETTDGFDELESKLLGTLVINQIINAVYLYSRAYEQAGMKPPPYYLYVDEAAEYVGDKLARTMELSQKTGLKVTIGHQSGAQFGESGVLNRIMTVSKMRVQFSLPGKADRTRMDREIGETSTDELRVQEARIQLPKQDFVTVRTPKVKDLFKTVSEGDVKTFVNKLFEAPWYQDARQLQKQLDSQYGQSATADPRTARPRETPDRPATDQSTLSVAERIRRHKSKVASGAPPEAASETGPRGE